MKLRVSNIGRVRHAEIEIDGITVIAGENNTGKSVMGKALWCMFNGYHNLHSCVAEERIARIADIVVRQVSPRLTLSNALQRFGIEDLLVSFVDTGDASVEAAQTLLGEISSLMHERFGGVGIEPHLLDDAVDEIVDAMTTDDGEILAYFLESRFSDEFYGQARSLYGGESGEVCLTIQSEEAKVSLSESGITVGGSVFDLHAEAVYFDDPFVLDDIDAMRVNPRPLSPRSVRGVNHRTHLQHLLQRSFGAGNALESIEAGKRLSVIYDKLARVCDGEVVASGPQRSRLIFVPHGINDSLALGNLSSGLKTFVMISILLMNGAIEKNGTIILDEPEIHLHPAWQVQLAELVVLLQKEFGLHVLLTCHSPYFIRAIETYSVKYGITDACHYYLSSVGERGVAALTDVSEDMEPIYRALFIPLQELENEQAYL